MKHLDEGTIHAWLDGALSEAEASDVERHVADCASCAAGVAEARGFIAATSRILSALDDVPAVAAGGTQTDERSIGDSRSAGVVPLPVGRVARTPSWQFRRATLVRVAAVLVIAAGTLAITQVMRGPRPLGA